MKDDQLPRESAQRLIRLAEELMVTRQALEHALDTQGEDTLRAAGAALRSVTVLSDQVNEVLRRWLEHESLLDQDPQ